MAGPALAARYYDGKTALAHDVTVSVASYGVDIHGGEGGRALLARWPRATLALSGSIAETGAVALTSTAAPDARLLLNEPAAARQLAQLLPQAVATHRRRNRRAVAAYASVALAILLAGAGAVQFLPEIAAPLVPFETKRAIGVAAFDSWFGRESLCTEPNATAPLAELGSRLRSAAGIDHALTIRVVEHPMANAFAMPGGIVVLTSGLITRAEDPDEVTGVLAHEIGHVLHDHPTVGMLRTMGISALLQLLSGGSGMEALASAGGTLAFLSYSRAAEEDADEAAIALLGRAGMRADGLSRFFARLQREEDGSLAGWIPSWLSTHPPTEARRRATERAAQGAPTLSAADWQRLRGVCDRPGERG